ncbi:MAG: sugar phosphate nucleotidyltransferase, partial [Bacteroidota bacterium]
GTRFKPWTDKHPKALAVIAGKTLLQRNVEYLQQYDITNVVVNVHHFADQIVDAVEASNGWGSSVIISDEKNEVLETGGGLVKAQKLLASKTFLTINVDILTDLNLHELLATHHQSEALMTLAVTDRKTSRYLLFDKNNRLCGWRNTTTGEEKIALPANELIEKAYSGIAVFEPQIFELITHTGKFSLIDVYLSLAANHTIMAFDHSGGRLLDVGKPESVAVAEKMFPQ